MPEALNSKFTRKKIQDINKNYKKYTRKKVIIGNQI
jgi:hypothetical protein